MTTPLTFAACTVACLELFQVCRPGLALIELLVETEVGGIFAFVYFPWQPFYHSQPQRINQWH